MAKLLKETRSSGLQEYREERYFYLMPAINTALRATTGEKWKNHKDWSAWWKKAKKGFVPLDDTTPLPADDEEWLKGDNAGAADPDKKP